MTNPNGSDMQMTLDGMVDLKAQLARTTQWQNKLYDLETPKIEKQLLQDKASITQVLDKYQVDESTFDKRIVAAMDRAIEKP